MDVVGRGGSCYSCVFYDGIRLELAGSNDGEERRMGYFSVLNSSPAGMAYSSIFKYPRLPAFQRTKKLLFLI